MGKPQNAPTRGTGGDRAGVPPTWCHHPPAPVTPAPCPQVFYWSHLSYVSVWALLILHAPNFWKWFVVPGGLFVLEKAVGLATSRAVGLRIVEVNLLPSKVRSPRGIPRPLRCCCCCWGRYLRYPWGASQPRDRQGASNGCGRLMQKGEGGIKDEGGDVSDAFARRLEGPCSSRHAWEGQRPAPPPCVHSAAPLLPSAGPGEILRFYMENRSLVCMEMSFGVTW